MAPVVEPEKPLRSKVEGRVSPDKEIPPVPVSVRVVTGEEMIGRDGAAPARPGIGRGGGKSPGKPGGGGPNPPNKGGRPKPRKPNGVNPCCSEALTHRNQSRERRARTVVFRCSMVSGTK